MSQSHSRSKRVARTKFLAIVIASVLLVVGALGYVGWSRMHQSGGGDFTGTGNGTVALVEITPGSSVSQLGPALVDKGIVKSNAEFQRAAANNPEAAHVTPGFYRLQHEMSAAAAVAALVDPTSKVQLLRVPNGATLYDVKVVGGPTRPGIFSSIQNLACGVTTGNCVTVAKLANVASSADPASLGVPAWAIKEVTDRGNDMRRLEGLIAPGDYVINPEQDAKTILTELITQSAKTYDAAGIAVAGDRAGLTPYQVLTAASLVEREAPADAFGKVARVIVNRLAEPMRLEFDSTVNYGLPEQEVATTDADRARETPWNTYAKDGLPDTPIASPSIEAVKAMENPTPGDWLFFVTTDKNGTTEFSNTLQEHQEKTQKSIDNGVLDSQRDQQAPAQ